MMTTSRGIISIVGLLVIGGFFATGICAAEPVKLYKGQTVYVPVYSHIYVLRGRPFELAISLSVRNTDPAHTITILSVAYNDSDGKLVRNYLESPTEVHPLSSREFFVRESDTTGGFGASFLVKWKSTIDVNEPIIEGVMVGTASGQGISFVSRGKEIKDGSKR